MAGCNSAYAYRVIVQTHSWVWFMTHDARLWVVQQQHLHHANSDLWNPLKSNRAKQFKVQSKVNHLLPRPAYFLRADTSCEILARQRSQTAVSGFPRRRPVVRNSRRKSVLVTGAAGFIGFHLASSLSTNGHRVVGIDNFNSYYDVSLKYVSPRRE
jgi:FlaA1/EpsC-like NDP-sugar epimerase